MWLPAFVTTAGSMPSSIAIQPYTTPSAALHQGDAGIALDLVWDHFVAKELGLDSTQSQLVLRSYHVLGRHSAPARLSRMVPALIAQDWLHRYADYTFTCRAIDGIGQRLSGPNRLAELLPWLRHDYPRLEQDFRQLWPDVIQALGVPPRLPPFQP